MFSTLPMTRLLAAAFLVLLASTACEDREASAPEDKVAKRAEEAAPAPAPRPREARVTADIELGQFETAVGDLAAWEAMPFGFQSVIYAANGEEGVVTIRADGGEAGVLGPFGAPPTKLAVAYDEEGQGNLVVLDAAGEHEVLRLPEGTQVPTPDIAFPAIMDLCSDGRTVFGLTAEGAVGLYGGNEVAGSVPGGFTACTAVNRTFYLRGPSGWARLTPDGAEATPLDPAASALVGAGGEVFALRVDGPSAALLVNDMEVRTFRPDGSPLRPLLVEPAYGNLGGVTRDGALIVLDEERRLYLLPWSEIANVLGLPGSLGSLRPVREEEDTGFALPRLGGLDGLSPEAQTPGALPAPAGEPR